MLLIVIQTCRHGAQLKGLILSGIPHVTDQLWAGTLPSLKQLKILVMGMPEGCCPKIHQKVLLYHRCFRTLSSASFKSAWSVFSTKDWSSSNNPSFLKWIRISGIVSLSRGCLSSLTHWNYVRLPHHAMFSPFAVLCSLSYRHIYPIYQELWFNILERFFRDSFLARKKISSFKIHHFWPCLVF